MLPGQPSRTLLRSAIRRAAHQLLDDPLILNDPIVVGLVPEASEQAIRDTLNDAHAPEPKLFRSCSQYEAGSPRIDWQKPQRVACAST